MKRMSKRFVIAAAFSVLSASAGSLTLEIGNPDANREATGMHATLVANVTACHEPAKSQVTASWVQWRNGEIRRTPLTVVALKTAGTFAVVGDVPQGSVIDLAVTNPEFKDYRPRVLVTRDARGPQWSGARRFFSRPPTDEDFKDLLKKDLLKEVD